MLARNKYYICSQNSIIKVSGSDRFDFLQGMVSNDLQILKEKKCIYCALLTPQGKFLYDFYILNLKDFFYLECSKKRQKEIIEKFNLFKLRANVNFSNENSLISVLVNNSLFQKLDTKKHQNIIHFQDPRNKSFFTKIYCENIFLEPFIKKLKLTKISDNCFEKIRVKNVIPDAEKDFKKEKILLLEARFDKLNGISWNKGCYIGQEVTAITNYRAKLKKQLYGLKIEGRINSDEIFYENKKIGFLTSYIDGFGIGILNIKETQDCISKKNKLNSSNALLEPFEPFWSKKLT